MDSSSINLAIDIINKCPKVLTLIVSRPADVSQNIDTYLYHNYLSNFILKFYFTGI